MTTDRPVVRSAVVLAGGRSRRFGPADKALAPIGGRAMVARVADRAGGVADEVIVNCRPAQRDRIAAVLDGDVRFAVDPPARVDGGPVAGLHTGLEAARAPLAAVVPCDVPRLPPALLDLLFVRTRDGDAAGAVPGDGERTPLALPGVYRTAPALTACEAVGAGGSLRAVTDRLDPLVLPPAAVRGHASPGALADVDRPSGLPDAGPD